MLLSNQISPHPRMNVPEIVGQRIRTKKKSFVKIKLTPLWLGGYSRFWWATSMHLSLANIWGTPPAAALASIGLANLTNPTKAVVPSDELIESYLKAYLSAIPRGQPTSSDRFLLLSPSRTPSLIKAFGHQHFCALSTSFSSS